MDDSRCIMFMLLQVLYFGLTSMTDILYVKKGSAITFECPFHSVAIPVQWRGPTNLTVISDGNNIKDTLQHFNRLTITGQHEIGEYNLQVIDFNAADQGLYRCNSMVNGFAVQKDFIVHLFKKPADMFIENATSDGILVVIEGNEATIACFVESGMPKEEMILYQNRQKVITGGPRCITYTFTPSRSDHLKNFTCTANNNYSSEIETTIKLFVKASPRVRIQGRRNIKVSEGSNFNLTCLIDSPTIEKNNVTWIFNENKEIRRFDRFDNSVTVLHISTIHRTNTGYYKCQVENEFGFGEDSVKINVTYKPTILVNGTTFEAKTEISKPVNVSFRVESFEIPLVFWHQTAGGKLNTWKIYECKDNKTFCLLSNIAPLTHKNFGDYSVRIRNIEGSTDLNIRLLYKDFHVQIKEERMVLKTSETIVINCSINPKEYGEWFVIWKHVWNGIFIRSFPSLVQNKTSTLELPHCDYKDTGEYVCNLNTEDAEFLDKVFVSVLGPPIASNKSISTIHNRLIFSVHLYINPPISKITWMHESGDKTTIVNLKALNSVQMISNTSVTIESYGKSVSVRGIKVKLVLDHWNLEGGFLVCQVQNSFAPAEESFGLINLSHLFSKDTLGWPPNLIETTYIPNSSRQEIEGVTKRQMFYISGGVFVFVAILICVLIYFLRRRKLNRRNDFKIDPISNTIEMTSPGESVTNDDFETISDRSYEDIGSINSSSAQVIDQTVISDGQYYESYKAETPTDLKVYEILNSKKDKINDNCDKESSSPCSEDSDSYIIPIRDYLELEDDDLKGHTVKDIGRVKYFDDFDGSIISKFKGDSSREIKRRTF